jgi:nicotinate-nucleotide adenylyltransferase
VKIGLFFGSFNPIHIGHLIIAQTMLDSPHIDELWFVVSPQNPHKKNKNLLHEFDRYDMVKAAIDEQPKFKVSDVEFQLSKPSFTINTLTVLREKYPKNDFSLIIGADNLASFHRWKNYESILENFNLLVYPRPQSKESPLIPSPKIQFVNAPMLDISATFVRAKIKNGHSIKYLVPIEVEEYIERKKLFL